MLTRGVKFWIDKFINDLGALALPWKYKGEDSYIQVAVRPIQLWEVVFPKEHYDQVMNTIFDGMNVTQHKKHQKFVYALRKVLGVKKVKEYKTDKKYFINRQHLETVPIGIKDDYDIITKTEGL